MPRGFDTTANCGPLAAQIGAANYDFVARYYAHGGAKRLTLAEAKSLSAQQIKIVAVWEDAPKKASYFSRARGVNDGTTAYHFAMLIGQPARTPIYFAVDFDAATDAIAGAIADYFKGIADGFATIAGNQAPAYRVGVYGSGATCAWLLNHELVTYTWLAQSTGWRGYAQFNKWNIKQGAQTKMLGIAVDPDDAIDDYGGFLI